MEIKTGKSVFAGIAIGQIYIFDKGDKTVRRDKTTDFQGEIQRFETARATAKLDLQTLYEKAVKEVGETNAMIFEVHQMMLHY